MKELCKNIKNKKSANKSILAALMMSAFASSSMAIPLEDKTSTEPKKDTKNTLTMKSIINLNFNKGINQEPKIVAVPESNQIIIDLPDVDKSFNAPSVQNNDPLIARIFTRIVDNKVKVIVETKQPVKFKFIKMENKGVLLLEESPFFYNEATGEKIATSVKSNTVAGLSNNWSNISSPKTASVVTNTENIFTEITKINVKKDTGRNTKISIDFSNKMAAPVMKKEGNKLIIDFKNVSIPSELQRRINTESLNSVTQAMDVSMQQNNGKLVLEQKDNWDYSFYQLEKQFVIDVKPIAQQEEEKKYIGKKLSISFQDMEVRAILQVIADFTGLNIMSSDKVTGTMTIRLKDVPWDQALDLVLESRGLQKVKDGNVVWVATAEEVTTNNRTKLELQTQNVELEPLKLEFFQINYYKAEDLKKVLEGKSDNGGSSGNNNVISMLSKRGTIGVDPRNNVLFIQETEEKLKELRKLIRKLDIANKQVLVEAKIVIADSDFGRDLGSRFGVKYRRQNGNGGIGVGGSLTESSNQASGLAQAITPQSNLASQGINSITPGVIGLTLLNMASGNALGLELSALEVNNRGKVLSSPRLLTADNKKATIEQGTEIPYVTPGSSGSPPTVSFKKAVLQLDVTPQIAPNGKVVLDLNIRKDSIGQNIPVQGGGQIPSIDTKNINTMVTVNNGQTVVLGGVYEIESKDDLSKIPLFGDIPLLGNLFKHSSKNEAKGELMIFITPYIIEEADLDETGKEEKPNEITLNKK
jgi:type IV pilus assembly protein PilQ